MKMKLVTRLTEEVEHQLVDVHKLEVGSEAYDVAVDGVSKLAGTIVDLQKAEADLMRAEQERRESVYNQELELKRYEAEQKDRRAKNWLTGVGIGAPIVAAIWANVYNWNKEVSDVMTNNGGKRAMDFLLGFRKK